MHIQLQRIAEARQSLRALEEERSRFLAAGEMQYLSGHCHPDALNHTLQMIENAETEYTGRSHGRDMVGPRKAPERFLPSILVRFTTAEPNQEFSI